MEQKLKINILIKEIKGSIVLRTFQDIKTRAKLAVDEFNFKFVGIEPLEGVELLKIEGTPISEEVGEELGYGKVQVWVHEPTWMVIKAEYFDTNLNPLKSVRAYDIKPVENILTVHMLVAENHQTGHKTEFRFSEIDYTPALDEGVFTESALRKGQ